MGTQNDINAKFYDIIYSQVKDDVETDGEIALVSSLGTRGSSVLDIGCGSGRHAMKLSEKGFDVVGIDNSLAMLSEARKKSSNTNITFVHKDILSFESSKHFDLICSFWNGINEIALTHELLEKFF
jgi:ubiquinone/menaquinone biosynthesis C-methylase UbiE